MLYNQIKLNYLFLNTSVAVCLFPSSLICYNKRAVTGVYIKDNILGS